MPENYLKDLDGFTGANLLEFTLKEIMENFEPHKFTAIKFLNKVKELENIVVEESKSREIESLTV